MGHAQHAFQSVDDRINERVKVRIALQVDLGNGKPEPCEAHDISTTGLLIETLTTAAGESVLVHLPDGSTLQAAVIWSGDRFLGCRFGQPISRARLRQIKQVSPVVWPDFGRPSLDLAESIQIQLQPVDSQLEPLVSDVVRLETALNEERRMSPRNSMLVIAASAVVSWGVLAACVVPLL